MSFSTRKIVCTNNVFFHRKKKNALNKTWNQILIKTQIFRVKNHSNNAFSLFRNNKRNKHYIVETPSNATSNRCLHFHPASDFHISWKQFLSRVQMTRYFAFLSRRFCLAATLGDIDHGNRVIRLPNDNVSRKCDFQPVW